jgi:hypothetical protein
MTTVVHDDTMTNRVAEREVMSAPEIEALAERTALELLAMSWPDALRMLDAGEFDGQGVEATLRGIKRLLAS